MLLMTKWKRLVCHSFWATSTEKNIELNLEAEFRALGEKENLSPPDLPEELIMMICDACSSKTDKCNL